MIDARDLVVRRGGRPVVRVEHLALEHGLVAVMGPNGAGKTSLMLALDGQLDVEGHLATDATWLVGTEPPVPTLVDVSDVVASHGAEDPDRWLEAVGYDGPRNLAHGSSGERMLVALAGALARQGADLLLDEPLGHLDPPHAARVVPRLRERANDDVVLFTTHDPLVAGKAERVLLLDGEVVADGPPEDVIQPGPMARCYGAEMEVLWTDMGPVVEASEDGPSLGEPT